MDSSSIERVKESNMKTKKKWCEEIGLWIVALWMPSNNRRVILPSDKRADWFLNKFYWCGKSKNNIVPSIPFNAQMQSLRNALSSAFVKVQHSTAETGATPSDTISHMHPYFDAFFNLYFSVIFYFSHFKDGQNPPKSNWKETANSNTHRDCLCSHDKRFRWFLNNVSRQKDQFS